MWTSSISNEGGVDEDVDGGGVVAIGLGGYLILALIVEMFGLSVLVTLLSFLTGVCRSQHSLGL